MKRKRRGIITALTLILVFTVCITIWGDSGSDDNTIRTINSAEDLNGKRVGVQTGTTFDEIIKEAIPNAEIHYFNTYPDMAAALEANKIDAFPGDEPVLLLMSAENEKLTLLDDRLDSFDRCLTIPKGRKHAGSSIV